MARTIAQIQQSIVDAKTEDDIITYRSNAGLPARALKKSQVFEKIKDLKTKTRDCIDQCLNNCGYRDGHKTLAQMCIFKELLKSNEWGNGEGLMFTGLSATKIKTIETVEKIMKTLRG